MSQPRDPKFYFGLTALAVILGGGFLYWQNSSLDPLREEQAQLSEKVKEQQDINKKLDDSKVKLTELQTQLAHVEQGIPDNAYVPTMLKELELDGKEMGIEVAGLRPIIHPPQANNEKTPMGGDKKAYEPLDIEMKGKGSYESLVRFVEALNTFPKIVEVRTIGVQPPALGNRDKDSRLDFTLGMRAFLFKQPTAPKPTEDTGAGGPS